MPTALKTRQALRVDAITQSVTPSRGSNYRSTCDVTALTLADFPVNLQKGVEGPVMHLSDASSFTSEDFEWTNFDRIIASHSINTKKGNKMLN